MKALEDMQEIPEKAIRIMFMDEARFGRISVMRRCWAPKGMRPVIASQYVREYMYVFAGVCPFDGDIDALILPDVSAEGMTAFLAEVSGRHQHEHVVMILDQAGWHTAANVSVPANITLFWLPAYSPELNPVEHLWDELREKWFSNQLFRTLKSVEEQLITGLRFLMRNPSAVKSQTLFSWMLA